MRSCRVPASALFALALAAVSPVRGADAVPTDNPIATYYAGPEGYPAWTDEINWRKVINMKEYKKGNTEFDKFNNAVKDLSETGGVLYYPAGIYDFTKREKKGDEGRGLMLVRGVVIRGEAPAGHPVAAADGKLDLPTKFRFKFRDRLPPLKEVPSDWNIIGLGLDDARKIKNMDHLGIAWVHLIGATVSFGPQLDWGKTWASAGSLLSSKVKKGGWDTRYGEGTHPIDPLMGGGTKYEKDTRGRFVFGCKLEDAAVLDDFTDPGYGPDGFRTSPYCARIIAYGSRILVANNSLPRSQKSFAYQQRLAGRGEKDRGTIAFDYGKTIGIDVNKELLTHAAMNGTCPGYFEEGVVVRDNYVFNHGHTGYSISGKWVTIAHNRNERLVLGGAGGVVTLDGWTVSTAESDNRSRAFDLAGRNLWVDDNHFNNTGSRPGNDGEGIIGRAFNGTPIFSWAITRNFHAQGNGSPGGMGGLDVDCHGLLIAWNQSPGWVGNKVKSKGVKMADCAFLAAKGEEALPNLATVKQLDLQAPLTASPTMLSPPTGVTAEVYEGDAVKVAWTASPGGGIGYRVERRIGEGKWQVIAYRPPRLQGDPENPAEWVDFTAPTGKELTYRVVAVNIDDTDKGASKPTEPVTLSKPVGL
jgi:hypothetical protein